MKHESFCQWNKLRHWCQTVSGTSNVVPNQLLMLCLLSESHQQRWQHPVEDVWDAERWGGGAGWRRPHPSAPPYEDHQRPIRSWWQGNSESFPSGYSLLTVCFFCLFLTSCNHSFSRWHRSCSVSICSCFLLPINSFSLLPARCLFDCLCISFLSF